MNRSLKFCKLFFPISKGRISETGRDWRVLFAIPFQKCRPSRSMIFEENSVFWLSECRPRKFGAPGSSLPKPTYKIRLWLYHKTRASDIPQRSCDTFPSKSHLFRITDENREWWRRTGLSSRDRDPLPLHATAPNSVISSGVSRPKLPKLKLRCFQNS